MAYSVTIIGKSVASGGGGSPTVTIDQLNAGTYLTSDCSTDGLSGTPNDTAWTALKNELQTNTNITKLIIPRGRYYFSSVISLMAVGSQWLNRHLEIYADGATFFFGAANAENRIFIQLGGSSPTNYAARIYLEGLRASLNRPSIRTGGSDMINVRYTRDFEMRGVHVPIADNMAFTIGRDSENYFGESCIVEECYIGGGRSPRTYTVPDYTNLANVELKIPTYVTTDKHSHASVGDTGIWILNPARITRVNNNRVRETGDDGIYFGHNNTGQISGGKALECKHNTLRWISGGIGSSHDNIIIDGNTVDTCLNNAYRLTRDEVINNGSNSNRARLVNNFARRVGFFTWNSSEVYSLADIGRVSSIAFRLEASNVYMANNDTDITYAAGFKVTGLVSDSSISTFLAENNRWSRIGCSDKDGTANVWSGSGSPGAACYERTGADGPAVGNVNNFTVINDVYEGANGSNWPFVNWCPPYGVDDTNIRFVNIHLKNFTQSSNSMPLVWIQPTFTNPPNTVATGTVKPFFASFIADPTVSYTRPLRFSGTNTTGRDFTVLVSTRDGTAALSQDDMRGFSSGNGRQLRVGDVQIAGARELATGGGNYAEIDANKSWIVEVHGTGNNATNDVNNRGAFLYGFWDSVNQIWTAYIDKVANGGVAKFVAVQNLSNTYYATSGKGALEIRPSGAYTGAMEAQVIIRRVIRLGGNTHVTS